ncbi:hypothetical protein NQ318_011620 [Aromia moschata]|uniref:Transposase n=1 Tax=Aromia moschata TaxID=1265417 RepID=A0AAV8Z9F1_9CUCU|nr:hypothetical protein NQ318_011620 [Aromia moschata]
MLSIQMEQRYTGINVYPAHKLLNGLNGLKRYVKRPKTIRVPDGPQRGQSVYLRGEVNKVRYHAKGEKK